MKRYPKYKDSSIEWLGEVPEHWEVKRLKHNISAITGNAFDSDDYKENGIPLIRIGDVSTNGIIDVDNTKKLPNEFLDTYHSYIVENGDILMAMTGATIGKVGKYNYDNPALLNQRVIKFKATSMNQHYLWFIVNSNNYLVYIKLTGFGGAQANISDKQLLDFPATNPPIEEQQAIASYLDRETERIDLLIKKKERMIELLKEKRIAVISNAATKGLNRDVKMKDSGIEWLGEIPEHWEVKRVGKGYSIKLGKMIQPEPLSNKDVLFRYLKAINVHWNKISIDDESLMWATDKEFAKYSIRKGDLLVCEGGEAGRAAILDFDVDNTIIQNALHRVRSKVNNVCFLQRILEVAANRGWFDILCNKATIAHFTREKFSSLLIPYPPRMEQDQIVNLIKESSEKIDKLASKVKDSITLLREYRSALITAAVTGKIDVRDEKSLEFRVES